MDLAGFAKWAVSCSFDGSDVDGGDIQNMAVKYGILTETKYNAAVHGVSECTEYVHDGDPWFVFSDEFKSALPKG